MKIEINEVVYTFSDQGDHFYVSVPDRANAVYAKEDVNGSFEKMRGNVLKKYRE